MAMRSRLAPCARRAAAVLPALLIVACASRAAPLVLPAGHPADPATGPSVGSATSLAPPARETPAPTPATPDAARGYVCPMHPEVTSGSPGACPKCGMALVPVSGERDRGAGHEEHR